MLPGSRSVLATQTDLSNQLQIHFSYLSAFVQDASAMSQARYKILNDRGYRPLLRSSQTLIIRYLSSEISQLQSEEAEEGGIKKSWKQADLSNLIKGYRLLWMFSSPTTLYAQQDKILSTEEQLHETQISRVYEISIIRCYDEFKWLAQSQLSLSNTVGFMSDNMVNELQAHLFYASYRLCADYRGRLMNSARVKSVLLTTLKSYQSMRKLLRCWFDSEIFETLCIMLILGLAFPWVA